MLYIKKYEGFSKDNFNQMIFNKKTFANKIERVKLDENKIIENNEEYDQNLEFEVSVVDSFMMGQKIPNLVDFQSGIPSLLRSLSIGYKIYKFLLNNIGFEFIITTKDSSLMAKNLWCSLLTSDEFFAGTNENYGIIIKKPLDNKNLNLIYDRVKNLNFKFDDDLKKILKL